MSPHALGRAAGAICGQPVRAYRVANPIAPPPLNAISDGWQQWSRGIPHNPHAPCGLAFKMWYIGKDNTYYMLWLSPPTNMSEFHLYYDI
jgi:hypothetical protein